MTLGVNVLYYVIMQSSSADEVPMCVMHGISTYEKNRNRENFIMKDSHDGGLKCLGLVESHIMCVL